MRLGKEKKPPKQTIFEMENDLRKKAIELSKNRVEKGKIKYLLKN